MEIFKVKKVGKKGKHDNESTRDKLRIRQRKDLR